MRRSRVVADLRSLLAWSTGGRAGRSGEACKASLESVVDGERRAEGVRTRQDALRTCARDVGRGKAERARETRGEAQKRREEDAGWTRRVRGCMGASEKTARGRVADLGR